MAILDTVLTVPVLYDLISYSAVAITAIPVADPGIQKGGGVTGGHFWLPRPDLRIK